MGEYYDPCMGATGLGGCPGEPDPVTGITKARRASVECKVHHRPMCESCAVFHVKHYPECADLQAYQPVDTPF